MLALAMIASLLPQGPIGLEARLQDLGLAEQVSAVLEEHRKQRPHRRLRPDAPELVRDLQRDTDPVLDTLLERLDVRADYTLDLTAMRLFVANLSGASRPPKPLPRRLDLHGYQSLLEDVFRELNSVLGSGLEPYEVVPALQSTLVTLQSVTDVGDLDRRQLEAVRDQVARVAKVDQQHLLMLAHRVAAASVMFGRDERYLQRLATERARDEDRAYAVGEVIFDRRTTFGRMVVGGTGRNVYDCSQIDVVVDLGGDDVYNGPAGATLPHRRLGVVFDLSGNDTYTAQNDSLGSATYGIGLLLDLLGDDEYEAHARSGGFGAAGAGVFLDLAGDDTVHFGSHAGGVGFAGIGIFADLGGRDVQTAEALAFGLGLPAGIGLFLDAGGDDERSLGAIEVEDQRGVERLSIGLGSGTGLEGMMAGGVGLAIDGGGNDVYEAAGMALGSAAYGGVGLLLDLAGDDRYQAGTSSIGSAHHGGLAVFLDARGDDSYSVTGGLGLGAAASCGQAWCVDVDGSDIYRMLGPGLGSARPSGLAGFIDMAGVDEYFHEDTTVPWVVRDELNEQSAAPSVGLFLDEGGEPDRYRWLTEHAPENGAVRRTVGAANAGHVRVLADR